MTAPIIHFDYDFSPYGVKTKLLLSAVGVDFQKCDQPILLPRPDLEALGITYRRIPLLAIGKDVYGDSSLIIEVILTQLGKLPRSPGDKAYETWGNTVFQEVLGVIPQKLLSPEFVQDRAPVFPFLARPDLKDIRPSSLASLRSRMKQVEEEFLSESEGPFISGAILTLADIHVIWPIMFALNPLGAAEEPSCCRSKFPKTYRLIDNMPKFQPAILSAHETQKAIRQAQHSAKYQSVVDENEPVRLSIGTKVSIESTDSEPGKYPQVGNLISLDDGEVVIEVRDSIHFHLPRIGYIIKAHQDMYVDAS